MTRILLFCLLPPLLLSTACARIGPDTPRDACERAANKDPGVKLMIEKAAGSPHYQRENEDRILAAKQDATVACLRARGIVRGGGVERPRE